MKNNRNFQNMEIGRSLWTFTKKIPLVMKLFIFYLFCSIGMLQAGESYAQNARLSLNVEEETVANILHQIENASDFDFFYNNSHVDLDRRVSISAQNSDIFTILNEVFEGTRVQYTVLDKKIILSTEPTTSTQGVQQQKNVVKGKVVDTKGEPVVGATIKEANTNNGTITNVDGLFTITVQSNALLEISFIGYKTETLKATSDKMHTITLKEDNEMLDEVVVVGYGIMKKSDLTGAVASIRGNTMEKEQRQTIQDMLRTAVAGISVNMETDAKGNSSMLIRGRGTIAASTEPLIVLDGTIYSGQITDINPNDIERIDILKDASSTAVYGAQAANGVVLITTKKGRGNKPSISFNGSWGWAMVHSQPDVYEGQDFVDFRQAVMESAEYETAATGYFKNPAGLSGDELTEWLGSDSGDPTEIWLNRLRMTNTEVTNYIAGKTTDWEKITQQTALRQDYTISVSGNKENMSYYSSINYLKNESNDIGSSYSAIRARINLENNIKNFLTYGVNAQFTARDEGKMSGDDGGPYASWNWELSPYGNVYDENGVLTYYPNDNNNASNPLLNMAYTSKKKDYNNLNSSLYLKLNLPWGFSLQTTYSPRFEWIDYMYHKSAEHPNSGNQGGYVHRYAQKDFYWQWDNMLKWNKRFNKHELDFTGLVNWEKFQRWKTTAKNESFQPNDNLGWHGIGYGTVPSVNSDDIYRTGDALMARLHYVYSDRYLVTATIRRDGYSAFGQANPHAVFPSIALGWVFTEEPFLKQLNMKWLEYGKLRISYGKNGNRSVGEYAALMSLEPRKYIYIDPQTGETVLVNTFYCYNMANPNLKWETTTSYNIGIDFSVLNGHLGGSLDIYHKSTTDLLNNRLLPSLIGYSSVKSNIGEIWNQGVELSVNSNNIRNSNLTWRTTFNLAYNKNTIKHLYGLMENITDKNGNIIGQKEADDITNGYFIGHALDEIWGYKFIGVWQESEVEEAAKYGQRPGDPHIFDADNNYQYNNNDKVFLGNTTPKVRWNMRNEFTIFKDFDISFSMYSYLGHVKTMARFANNHVLLNTTNQIKREYWTPNNPINDYPRLSAKSPSGISYNIYKSASFLRVDNLSFGYTFPKDVIKPLKMEKLRINLTVKNLGYLTKWPAWDPENPDSNTPRTITIGVNMTL